MQRFSTFEITELKLVYRVLHQKLMSHMELMDADFLEVLQRWLQYRAAQDGVNLADHAQWDGWLNDRAAPSVEASATQRVIPLSLNLDND
jgi:hypothetical protein